MTKEDKELLLKDLCARLPYKLQVEIIKDGTSITDKFTTATIKYLEYGYWDVKPYLLPLSSMTDEQKEELKQRGWYFDCFEIYNVDKHGYREAISHEDCFDLIDWLNKNHFDYRNLIDKNLAIDCTNLNIY